MQVPLQVTFRDIPHSAAIEAHVRERAAKLETLSARVSSCHVVVEAPHRHQHTGRHFRVRIDLMIPRGELVASHAPDEDPANENAHVAIDEAFDRLDRRLEDHVRRLRGDVKPHDEHYRDARVSKLWSYEGFGFLRTTDGSEVYFHKNSVLHHAFDRLHVGSSVRFLEEDGEKGPQASTVTLVRA